MYPNELSTVSLEASLEAKIERYFDPLDKDPDVLAQLLADKRSPNTRRAYEKDVNDFFKSMTGLPATPDNILEFLHLEQPQAVAVVLKYKSKLVTGEGRKAPLKEATVNRRIAAIKSLVAMGRKIVFVYIVWKISQARRYKNTGTPAASTGKHLKPCYVSAIARH